MAKAKKHDLFIDMTAMSDVTVLLLTFFMLTATFLPKEAIQVITPASVSEIKVPDYNVMTILIAPKGQVYLTVTMNDSERLSLLDKMATHYNVTFTDKQKRAYLNQPSIGVPMNRMPALLDMPSMQDQDEAMRPLGVPADSTNNQLALWIRYAGEVNENVKYAIKTDKSTEYPFVDRVMKTLVEQKKNRYSLVTTLKGMPEGF